MEDRNSSNLSFLLFGHGTLMTCRVYGDKQIAAAAPAVSIGKPDRVFVRAHIHFGDKIDDMVSHQQVSEHQQRDGTNTGKTKLLEHPCAPS